MKPLQIRRRGLRLSVVGLTALLCCNWCAAAIDQRRADKVLFAQIRDGSLFWFVLDTNDANNRRAELFWTQLRGTATPTPVSLPARAEIFGAGSSREEYRPCFRLTRDHVWGITPTWPRFKGPPYSMFRMPCDELFVSVPTNDAANQKPRAPFLNDVAPTYRSLREGKELREFLDRIWVAPAVRPLDEPSMATFFDLDPIATDTCCLFMNIDRAAISIDALRGIADYHLPTVPRDRDQMLVFEYSVPRVRNLNDKDGPNVEASTGAFKLLETLTCEFLEPFYAFRDADMDFFVTASGSLYETRNDPERIPNRVVALFRGARSPIIVVIRDVASETTFAFTHGAWFQIGRELKVHDFNLGPHGDLKPDDPLPTLRRCVQALDAAALLKPKPKE